MIATNSNNQFFITCASATVIVLVLLYYTDISSSVSMTPLIGASHTFFKQIISYNRSDDLLLSTGSNLSSIDKITAPNKIEPSKPPTGLQGCPLPKIDPFDPSIKDYVNWKFSEKFRNCNRDFKIRSKYKNGLLEIDLKTDNCTARCFRQVAYHQKNKADPWTKLKNNSTKFDCEFLEVICHSSENAFNLTYAMIHTDIKPLKTKPKAKKKEQEKQYNLYIFVIDSVGNSAADRTLPRTMRFMEKSLEAVRFPYLNKVGQNSRPNGLALFMGKQIEPIDRIGLGAPSIKADWGWEESCKRYMDNESSIFQDFRNEGYRTLLTDDWKVGILNYPNCKGWKDPVVDHTMDALIEQSLSLAHKQNYYGNNCQFMHREDLKYLQQFINAYPNDLQFSLTWVAEVVHEMNEGPMIMDNDFLIFMMENRKKLENSFVVVLADHGNRLSSIIWTRIGSIDNNNPMLIMSIPKELRTPENMAQLRENSEKLQTHYDVRATLLDILKHQPASNFSDNRQIQMEGERGNSFFRKYEGERSCTTLPIPFSYCMCQYKQENVNVNSTISIEAGKKLIDAVNQRLREANLTEICNLWKFDKIESNLGYYPVETTGSMKIIVAASWPYSKARLTALVHRSSYGVYTVGKVDRVDRYGERGLCAKGQFEAICDCKKNSQ